MPTEEWFRNKTWNSGVEITFREKLNKSRSKSQHLRIQAAELISSHPDIAIKLADECLSIGSDLDIAMAYEVKASAYLTSNKPKEAVETLEKSLKHEEKFPQFKTSAHVSLPFIVFRYDLTSFYDIARQVLSKVQTQFTFPIEGFKFYYAQAKLALLNGERAKAQVFATRALEEHQKTNSGLQKHSGLGLVGGEFAPLILELQSIGEQ